MIVRVFIICFLCVSLSGCVSARKAHKLRKQVAEMGSMVALTKAEIQQRDMEILQMKKTIADKEAAIAERDKKIEDLKKKLEGFGIF